MKTHLKHQDFSPITGAEQRKAPAYPLVTHDPYFSIWSFTDKINEEPTKHWSGKENSLVGLIFVDGKNYLFLGSLPEDFDNSNILLATQNEVILSATKTTYFLTCGGIDLELTFCSPLLMDELELISRPVSYVSIKTRSNDKMVHEVQVYFGASSNIAVDNSEQPIQGEMSSTSNLFLLKAGTVEQPVLEKKGDDLRIDWGYMYVAAPGETNLVQNITSPNEAIRNFLDNTYVSSLKSGTNLMLNTIFPKKRLADEKEYLILLGYDDLYSINYFDTHLRPWWNRKNNTTIEEQLEGAFKNYKSILEKCNRFDKKLHTTAKKYGGSVYAKLLDLGYRQSISAHKLVECPDGDILFLSKENFSNGSINTVDVTYPSAPLFLIFNPDLLKGMLNGIFYYSESGKWEKPFPAHDLGTYPIATGQTYNEDMPVEEAGNMLILTAALVKAEGKADYAQKHWDALSLWVKFLTEEGFDPESQLCTDDFSGHLARNTNLSIKAIVGIGSYAYMAQELGFDEVAEEHINIARSMAEMWMVMADAGNHYALTFNDKNTWSQKYNLVWDKLLDLNIFPEEVYEKELAFYRNHNNKYGLPLDNRSDYTKSDWILWVATLTNNIKDFKEFVEPVYAFAIETEDRVPLTDWHYTSYGKMESFQARSVVGGFFLKFLKEEWKKEKFSKKVLAESIKI